MPEPLALTAIASEQLSAQISPLGAELQSLRDAEGRDLLWGGDPAVWASRAPILFPIVGGLAGGQYRLDGQTYALPRHGFTRRSTFELVESTPSSAVFRLGSSEATLAVYPFQFELDLAFAIDGATLSMTAAIRNLDETDMPASFGFHPALRWPLPYGQPREAHRLVFESEEPEPLRRLDAEGLILPQTIPTPVSGRGLELRDDLFANDALIWDQISSRRIAYGADQGPRLIVDFPAMPQLGVWTKPGAGYVCIEPWNGFADPQGYAGDLRDKPGIFIVPPGGTHRCAMSITLAT
jgi:galactose mutarotase-like enzyme